MDKLEKSIEDYIKIRNRVKIKPEHIDYKIAEQYLPFFRLMDNLKTSIIVVPDFYKNNYYYVSERFNDVFGFSKNKLPEVDQIWFRKRFHPDDYIINLAGVELHKLISNQPVENRKNFKLTHDFRIKNDTDNWIRLLVQDYILEIDKVGNYWLNMKLCDLSPVQDLDAPATSVCRNTITGEVMFSFEGKNGNTKQISDREKQVLSLVAEGMRSKEIAEQLFISANTVNNHRRNMINKLNVSNSSEAVMLALKLGII